MRSFRLVAVLFLASMLTLALGCGGGGGNGGGGGGGTQPLTIGTFVRTIEPSNAGNWTSPFHQVNTYAHEQHVVLAGDIQGSGYIQSVSLMLNANLASAVTCTSVEITMGHTVLSALTTTFASNVDNGAGSSVVVRGPAALTIPPSSIGEHFTIDLDTPFYYNGKDNLVIDLLQSGGCSATVALARTADVAGSVVHTWTNGSAFGDVYANGYLNMKLNFAGGDASTDYAVTTHSVAPFSAIPANQHLQMLHDAATIGGSGPITGVGIIVGNGPTTGQVYTVTVKLGHSNLSALTDTYANNFTGSSATLASALTFTVPAGVPDGSILWLPVTGSFTYNGTDNLIVDVDVAAATGPTGWAVSLAGSNNYVFGAHGVATGTVNSGQFETVIRFNGGPVSVITDEGLSTGQAFAQNASGASGRLNLYRAAELGTAGRIDAIACRLTTATSTTESFDNYKIIIGHSGVDTLDSTAANNFLSQQTAVNGTVTVPAGLHAGDWVEVALDSPFSYDGKSNLAIWMGTTAASGAGTSTNCALSAADAGRYPGQSSYGAPESASVAVQDYKFDLKLDLAR